MKVSSLLRETNILDQHFIDLNSYRRWTFTSYVTGSRKKIHFFYEQKNQQIICLSSGSNLSVLRLFQKCVVHTKFELYVFIVKLLISVVFKMTSKVNWWEFSYRNITSLWLIKFTYLVKHAKNMKINIYTYLNIFF